jgi:hypothetical protein
MFRVAVLLQMLTDPMMSLWGLVVRPHQVSHVLSGGCATGPSSVLVMSYRVVISGVV